MGNNQVKFLCSINVLERSSGSKQKLEVYYNLESKQYSFYNNSKLLSPLRIRRYFFSSENIDKIKIAKSELLKQIMRNSKLKQLLDV